MNVEVIEASGDGVRLRFPLEANVNHHGTAFGGSLSAAGILAGWSLLQVRLVAQGLEAATVVAESRTRYAAPIQSAFEALALAPSPEKWLDFLDMLARWGRGKLELRTEIRPCGTKEVAAVHDGIYVATASG